MSENTPKQWTPEERLAEVLNILIGASAVGNMSETTKEDVLRAMQPALFYCISKADRVNNGTFVQSIKSDAVAG